MVNNNTQRALYYIKYYYFELFVIYFDDEENSKVMNDYIIRATAADDNIRVFAMTSREIAETAREKHATSNVATAALGRLLTAGALMAAMQKNDTDVLTLQIGCAGPIGGLTVTAGTSFAEDGQQTVDVKGYVNHPNVLLPLNNKGKLDVGGALGPGILTVIKDMGLKEPFSGQTELVSGEIAEDLTYYFASSEQIPSSVALGVLVEPAGTVMYAGGFIIQLMPFASDEIVTKLEERLNNIEPVTAMLSRDMTPEQILEYIFEGMDLRIMDRIPARFKCNCSKERVKRAVMSIDVKDIREMIRDAKPIEVNCHFCGTNYSFSVEELKTIMAEKKK